MNTSTLVSCLILALAIHRTLGNTSTSCSDGQVHNERCYRLRPAATWSSAVQDCSSMTGDTHLFYTDTSGEQKVMRDVMRNDTLSSSVWLGANLKTGDAGVTDNWKWIDDTLISGQGCYLDRASDRDLPYRQNIAKVTPSMCVQECSKQNYLYAGVQNGEECYCGNSYGKHGMRSACIMKCTADRKQKCGASNLNFIYHTQGTFGQWAYAQPNNFVGNQYCGRISRHVDFKIGDEACAKEFGYMCDVDISNCDAQSSTSKTGYVKLLTRCLFVTNEPVNWFKARTDCKVKGGDLFKMDTLDLYNAVMVRYTSEPGSRAFWVGLHSRKWLWTNGIPIIYTNWETNYPLNDTGNCISAGSFDDYKWRNERCTNKLKYYCVTEPIVTTTLPPTTIRPTIAITTPSTTPSTTPASSAIPTAKDIGAASSTSTSTSTNPVDVTTGLPTSTAPTTSDPATTTSSTTTTTTTVMSPTTTTAFVPPTTTTQAANNLATTTASTKTNNGTAPDSGNSSGTPQTGKSTNSSSSLTTVELILIIFCVILLILIIIAIVVLCYFKKNNSNSVGPDNSDYRYKSTIPSSTPYVIDDGYATNSDYGSMAGLVQARQKSDRYVKQKIQIDDNRFDRY